MEFIKGIFDTSNWPARWQCGIWSPLDGWLYIISDFLTFSAYMAIPIILWYFLRNHKGDTPFKKVIWLFVLFIFFCGLTHLAEAVIFWYPFYRFSALLRLATAIVSILTAIVLYRNLPDALKFKSPKELEKLVKLRTKEIAQKEDELRLLINNLPEIVFRVNSKFEITIANNTFYKVKDNNGNYLTKMNLLHVDLDYKIIKNFKNYIGIAFSTNTVQNFDFERELKNKKYYYSVKIIPEIVGLDGFALCIIDDVSSIKKREFELESLLKEKENISRIIVHDVKSPLGTINKLSEMALEDANESSREVLNAIKSSSEKTLSIIEDLLNLSILFDSSNEDSVLSTQIINKVIKQNLQIAKEKQIEIIFDNQFEVTLTVIKVLIERALENLLVNAIKFSNRNSKIIIRSIKNKQDFKIEVEDNGIGIPDHHRNKLFEFKTNASRKGTEGEASTGIGLNLVNQIVKNHNGKLEVKSKVGEGSTFSIILPI